MKASLNVDDLKKMLKNAEKFTQKRGSFSDLNGKIVLSVHDGKFEVYALSFEGETSEFSQWVPVADVYDENFECVSPEDGAWTVSAKALAPLKAAKKGSSVGIDADGGQVKFSAPGLNFAANAEQGVYASVGYISPKFDVEPDAATEILPEDCDGFKYIVPAVSKDTTHPDFTGAMIQAGDLVATDGARLHIYPLAGLIQEGTFDGIISPKIINAIAGGLYGRLSERSLEPRGRATAKTWHVLEADGLRIAVQAIAGLFPDFRRVIPRYDSKDIAEIDAAEFSRVIKTLSVGWKNAIVGITQEKGGARLICKPFGENAPNDPARESFFPGEGFPKSTVAIDARLILDALAGLYGTICFCHVDADSATWFGQYMMANGIVGRGAIVMPIQW